MKILIKVILLVGFACRLVVHAAEGDDLTQRVLMATAQGYAEGAATQYGVQKIDEQITALSPDLKGVAPSVVQWSSDTLSLLAILKAKTSEEREAAAAKVTTNLGTRALAAQFPAAGTYIGVGVALVQALAIAGFQSQMIENYKRVKKDLALERKNLNQAQQITLDMGEQQRAKWEAWMEMLMKYQKDLGDQAMANEEACANPSGGIGPSGESASVRIGYDPDLCLYSLLEAYKQMISYTQVLGAFQLLPKGLVLESDVFNEGSLFRSSQELQDTITQFRKVIETKQMELEAYKNQILEQRNQAHRSRHKLDIISQQNKFALQALTRSQGAAKAFIVSPTASHRQSLIDSRDFLAATKDAFAIALYESAAIERMVEILRGMVPAQVEPDSLNERTAKLVKYYEGKADHAFEVHIDQQMKETLDYIDSLIDPKRKPKK